MLFNSFQFLLFFPVVTALYFLCPFRYRWVLLLGASYYFYACWRLEYLTLIIASTLVDYVAGIGIGAATTAARKRVFLIASLATNLGLLFTFKYFNFFNESLGLLLDHVNIFYAVPDLKVLLPVGISFYTFQTLSYTIDVYRGKQEPQRHLGIFAVYVSFFPQLVAGPIERSTRLMPQFFERHTFDLNRAVDGVRQMLWGFVKKVALADRLAYYVDAAYSNPSDQSGLALLLATYFFAFQIYFDFSGYSDIAIGTAKLMGYDLMTNFRQPYFSGSIREFWQRWHISLSTWFRDYVYIPLGGNRVTTARYYWNLMITFVVSGLWHGANWTFVIWGALHGGYLVVSVVTKTMREKVLRLVGLDRMPSALNAWQVFVTFHLVLFSWVFFRAANLTEVWLILGKIGSLVTDISALASVVPLASPFEQGRDILFILAVLAAAGVYEWMLTREFRILAHPVFSTVSVSLQFWFVVLFGMFDNKQFVYFQF